MFSIRKHGGLAKIATKIQLGKDLFAFLKCPQILPYFDFCGDFYCTPVFLDAEHDRNNYTSVAKLVFELFAFHDFIVFFTIQLQVK